MKRILLILLLASPAFAQVYSQMAIQNTQGNWLKASPGALVYLCMAGTSNNNCLAGIGTVPLFTDQNLNTAQPNPIVADANGNYTLFTVSGIYQQCVKAVTSFCQLIQVGGGSNGVPLLFRTNSPNCTTLNQLVTYDTVHLDANSVATVQNAAVGAKNVIGVVVAGAGCSGIATIGTYLSALVTMDGTSVVGNVVSPSGSVAGFASDEGSTISQANVQTIGRVSKANIGGAGTTAQVDFFLGDLNSPGSSSGSGTVSACSQVGSVAYYSGLNIISCDLAFVTDGAGHVQAKSLGLTDTTFAGFVYQTQGPQPTLSALNSVYLFPPTSVGTTFGLEWPGALPTNNDCVKFSVVGLVAQFTDAGSACGTTSTTFQVNATPTSAQNPINFQNSNTVTASNPSAGNVQFAVAGHTQAGTPTAPTLTTNGTPGSTTICYEIVGWEDPTGIFHTPASAQTCIATANATLSSSNSINLSTYIDTLYGVSCAAVYRISTTGVSPASTGLIAGCVGKKFIDTGLAGDSTTPPSTNTTDLIPNSASLPGCNMFADYLTGPDAPPCTPSIFNDEMRETFGAPGDANNSFWIWGGGGVSPCAQGGATAVWSSGAIILTSDSTNNNECLALNITLPAPPYTFEVWLDNLSYPSTNVGTFGDNCAVGLRESSTGKLVFVGVDNIQVVTTVTASGGNLWQVTQVGVGQIKYLAYQGASAYVRIGSNGTNLITSLSNTGDGIAFPTLSSTALSGLYTTAPNQLVLVTNATGGTPSTCVFDFARRIN